MEIIGSQPYRVLVIDDETLVRETIVEILADAPFEVREAKDGAHGIEVMEEFVADIVITDIIMPMKEGIETIIELRRRWPDVGIVAISGGGRNHSMDYLALAPDLGADAILPKPFRMDDVLKTVNSVLSARTTRQSA